MEQSYKDKTALLEKIVHDGIAKLLMEAKTKNYLDFPHGRAAFPTPLITEDDFIKDGALQGNDEEPEFKFEYGFDPLKFLADFIVWSHPNSVEDRRQKKIDASQFLQQRAEHARRQVQVSHNLSALADRERSGIVWGPLCSPLSCTSVMVSCKPLKKGKVIVQISKFRDFREVLEKQEIFIESKEDGDDPHLAEILPIKCTFKELKPATKHFIRACLSSNPVVKVIAPRKLTDTSTKSEPDEDTEEECASLQFKGLRGDAFTYSEFWTLASEDRAAQQAIEFEEPSTNSSEHPGQHKHGHHHHHHHHHHQKKPDIATETGETLDTYSPVLINCFGQLPVSAFSGVIAPPDTLQVHPLSAPAPRMDPFCPSITCLLGDLIAPAHVEALDNENNEATQARLRYELLRNLSKVLARCPVFESMGSPMHTSSLLLAWRDGSTNSHYSLRAEELAYRQFRQDVKRHKKKYAKTKTNTGSSSGAATQHTPPLPTIARLPFTDSLSSLLMGMPIDPQLFEDPVPQSTPAATNSKTKPNAAAVAAAAAAAAQAATESVKATRMMYRTQMMGPDVVMIVLDMRGQGTAGDYLGKEQAAWLDIVLQESATIQWKVILCGKTFGLINIPVNERPPTPVPGELELKANGEQVVTEGMEGLILESTEPAVEATPLEVISEDKEVEIPVPAKTVQLPQDVDKRHAAITAAMTEDVEDVYGRSAYSLHHILASHQSRMNQSPSYTMPNKEENRVMFLSSGIVLLTSGLTSVCPTLVATPAIHHHHSEQRDVIAPAYVAGYTNLNAASVGESGGDQEQALSDANHCAVRIPSMLFCAEVCLGSVGVNSGAECSPDPKSSFYFRDGFESVAVYSSVLSTAALATSPSLEGGAGGKSSDTCTVTTTKSSFPSSKLSSSTCCSLHLMNNGMLSVKVFRADSALRDGTCVDTAPIFECVMESPVPEDDEEDDLEDDQ